MKSAVIPFIVVIVLAAEATGIAATQPSTVPPYISALGSKIDALTDKVDAIGTDVLTIKSDVASIKTDLSSGNITRMMVLSGGKTVEEYEIWAAVDEEYPEVRHVSLTAAGGPYGGGEFVQLCYSVGETYMCENLALAVGRATYEFNTEKWELIASSFGESFHLSYAATVTYAP